jgi:hypothetical protein
MFQDSSATFLITIKVWGNFYFLIVAEFIDFAMLVSKPQPFEHTAASFAST